MIKNPITGNILPKGWKLFTVNDIKSKEKYSCVAGPFGSDISSQYFKDEGVPVIRGNNLSLNHEKFISEGFVFVSKERAEKYTAQNVIADDLVFTCWGTIGQVGIIPKNGPFEVYIISNKQLKLRVNKDFVNPEFLYYYFSSPAVVQYIKNMAIGSAVPGINLGLLKKLPIALPSLPNQNLIANLLGYFYELIENNKQRIKLLEEMAEEIYKEWFVRLRFPNYENTEFVDGLPKGWENSKIKDFGKVITGKTPSTVIAEYYGGEIPFIKTPDMHGKIFLLSTEETITELGKNSQKSQTIPENSICVNCIGALSGSVSITTEISQTNQQIHSIVLNTLRDREFLFFLLRGLKPYILQLGNTGATMTNVSKGKFENIDVIKPSEDVIENFSKITFSIFEEIKVLSQKNQLLQQTRDLLLPRLISGKLSVEGLAEVKEYVLEQNGEHWPMAAEAEGEYHH